MEEEAKKIRVALGSNDGEKIIADHMGQAEDFYIYDVFEGGKSLFIEKRKNTSPAEEGRHGLAEKMKVAIEIIRDADILVGRVMSPNFINIATKTKFQPVIVEADKISDIMRLLGEHFSGLYDMVEKRRSGERSREIPKINNL